VYLLWQELLDNIVQSQGADWIAGDLLTAQRALLEGVTAA
jgi:hypothetical protein